LAIVQEESSADGSDVDEFLRFIHGAVPFPELFCSVRKVSPRGAGMRGVLDEGQKKRMEGGFGRMNREDREQGAGISQPRRRLF
jgi:hypothetical protein